MTADELHAILDDLRLSQGAFAAIVNRYAGTALKAGDISRMCSAAPSARPPSPVVQAVARFLIERRTAARAAEDLAQIIADPAPQ